MKRVVILQPGYLPWLGFFDQLDLADEFVIYDDVQYDRRGWRNRNRIKTPAGPLWLTVPVVQKGKFSQLVCEAEILNDDPWAEKQLKSIQRNYSSAPFFDAYFPLMQEILSTKFTLLVDLDLAFIRALAQHLGVTTPLIRSSAIGITGGKTDRLVSICEQLHATHYLTGNAAHDYIELEQFAQKNIQTEFHDYVHPVYKQLFNEFIPYLSVIDLLFNHGPDSLSILSSRGKGKF